MKKQFVSAAVLLLSTMLALAACQSGPQRQITRGDEVAYYDFSAGASFEEGSYSGAVLRVREGAYHIDVRVGDGTLWWGQYGDTLSDVIIDVDVEQTSMRPETVYGVMCRVRGSVGQSRPIDPTLAVILTDTPPTSEATPDVIDATAEATAEAERETGSAEATQTAESTFEATAPAEGESTPESTAEATIEAFATLEPSFGDGDGYLFLVQGTGAYAIMRARGRDVRPLVNWTPSDQINPVPGRNHLRAVCVDNYLAFYINDVFMAETTDDAYSQGQVGLVAGAANPLGASISFDNLSVAVPAE